MKLNGQCVPCVRNSSYSFMQTLLKLYVRYGHGLKISIFFAYNLQIIFLSSFHNLNLVGDVNLRLIQEISIGT